MDPTSVFIGAAFGFAFAAGFLRLLRCEKAAQPAPLIDARLDLKPGSVVLLTSTRTITQQQYSQLRAHLDSIEAHTGAKLAVIDGWLKVSAVRSSE